MSTLAYSVECSAGTPPNWLSPDVVRTLVLLAETSMPLVPDPDVAAASVRARHALGTGAADIPLAVADCLALFTPFAELDPDEQDRAVHTTALLLGDGCTGNDVLARIADLDAAIDTWTASHRAA